MNRQLQAKEIEAKKVLVVKLDLSIFNLREELGDDSLSSEKQMEKMEQVADYTKVMNSLQSQIDEFYKEEKQE